MVLCRHFWILLSQLYLIQSGDVDQQMALTIAEHGGSVTLKCVTSEKKEFMYWYKQTLGHMLQLVATKTSHGALSIDEHFKYKHFSAEIVDNSYFLNIKNISNSDEGIYFCQTGTQYGMFFRYSTFVAVRGNYLQRAQYYRVVQQSESEPVHPGDSVTLQCSVLSQTCTGQHSVFWFRAGSGESHPGLIYTQGNRSGQCEKRPEPPSPTQSCFYSLSMNNLSFSDTGTYYCAVATCGEILFGNGTILEVAPDKTVDPLVIVLWVTSFCLAFSVIFIIILICTRNPRSLCEHCNGSPSRELTHDTSTRIEASGGDEVADTLNYAALHFSERKLKRGRKKKETTQESVYTGVRYSDRE